MYSIRCVLIFLAVAGTFFSTYGQDAPSDPKKEAADYVVQADEIMKETKAMDIVRDMYVLAANLDPENLKANFMAGYMHINTIQKDRAAEFFMRVYKIDPNYRFDLEYWLGLSYQHALEFDKAIDFYNRYKEKLRKRPNYQGKDKKNESVADQGIFECENGKVYVANPKNFSIVNLGGAINSELDDYGAVFTEAEDEVVFTSRRSDGNVNQDVYDDNKPYEDIFISRKKDGQWSSAQNIGETLNTPSHDSNLALSADGKTLFIYTVDNGGDIYFSKLQSDESWGKPLPLPGVVNSTYEEKSISITKDEKTLYFSSDRPGGFGGYDIYMATKNEKGEWINVKNLGEKINTDADDEGPFIDYDNKTLYFSSKGHKTMGGYDIFKTVFDNATKEWSDPENLGYPINTPDNDIYFVSTKDGKRAYYSSVREDGLGYDDIYMITGIDQISTKKEPEPVKEPVKEPVVVVIDPVKEPVKDPVKEPVKEPAKVLLPLRYVVQVVDAEKNAVNAKVKLQGMRDNIVVGSSAKGDGTFEFNITAKESKDYRLSVEAEGFMFVNQSVKLEGASEKEKVVTRTVEMRKLEPGMVSILRNIYFDFDKATFKQDSYNELNKLERMMAQNPNMKVEISGHTDVVGSKNYNTFLSRKRAEAVKDFLTKKGIDGRRIKAVGYGSSKPLASNDDEDEGRELNRRVEFKVTGN